MCENVLLKISLADSFLESVVKLCDMIKGLKLEPNAKQIIIIAIDVEKTRPIGTTARKLYEKQNKWKNRLLPNRTYTQHSEAEIVLDSILNCLASGQCADYFRSHLLDAYVESYNLAPILE